MLRMWRKWTGTKMSYCRFGEADAYIYLGVNGLECCGCIMAPKEKYPTPYVDMFGLTWEDYSLPVGPFETTREMLKHIAEHRAAGHHIPEYVDERLKNEYPDLDTSTAETEEERLEREQSSAKRRERMKKALNGEDA